MLRRWQAFLRTEPARAHPLLAPWIALTALPVEGFAAAAADLLASWRAAPPPGMDAVLVDWLAARERRPLPSRLSPDCSMTSSLSPFRRPKNAKSGKAKTPAPVRVAVPPSLVADAQAWGGTADFPANLTFDAASVLIRRQLNERTAQLRRELESLNWTEPGAPLRAMALVDRDKPRDSAVFLRGNPANRGPEAPRRFLEVLAGPDRPRFSDGSGRLELARAIADPANPLTARVFVNRVWGWHFGEALVRTPSDFGVRTEPSEQRALLDWLAADFMAGGWSVKRLHRAIVLSRTYRQSGSVTPATLAADPENRFLTRFNRRRLEFEALRDTLLAAAGRLDPQVGGLPVDLLAEPFPGRRTVYGFIDRQNLPGMFRTFDLPNPDVSSAQRFSTTVPQQALFLLNSPFALEMARAAADRAARIAAGSPGGGRGALPSGAPAPPRGR